MARLGKRSPSSDCSLGSDQMAEAKSVKDKANWKDETT